MHTVLTNFYHPNLGTVRGTVIEGIPMVCYREVGQLLCGFHSEEIEKYIRSFFCTKEVIVPIWVTKHGNAITKKLLFIDQKAVCRLIEGTSNRAWQQYAVWFHDFIFPCLTKMWDNRNDPAYAAPFYWTCHDPEPPKPHNPQADTIFDDLQ